MIKSKWILPVILLLAFFLRAFRPADFLGFWFDQGRDAKIIWNFLYVDHKPFLIGPTTGIEGIFLGPFYYYLLVPFYLLGRGDPVYPALGLAGITTAAVYLVYRLGRDYFDHRTGILAAALYGLSFHTVMYHRWLSNPTPLPLFALISFASLLSIIHASSSRLAWPVLGLALGLSLHLEAASAVFFLPAAALILFLNRKPLIARLVSFFTSRLLPAGFFFGLTLLPQLIFNFRHENIIGQAFSRFLVTESSFRPAFTEVLSSRLAFYYEIFTNKFYFYVPSTIAFLAITFGLGLLLARRLPPRPFWALVVWLAVPVVGLLFYQGNKGYVWDYYFTGVYPILFILVAAVWGATWKYFRPAVGVVLVLLVLFLFQNLRNHLIFFRQSLPGFITLTPIVAAVDWVYTDSADQPFNTDVYVPPVIPHAYDYVFLWRGAARFNTAPRTQLVRRLYTLLEPDFEHPQLRDTWLVRQSTIGSIETEKAFGPVTVQRRQRFLTAHE